MSLLERIMLDVSALSLPDQIDVARYIQSKTQKPGDRLAPAVQRLRGLLPEDDIAFLEEAARGVKPPSTKDQVRFATLMRSLNPRWEAERREGIRSFHGVLSEEEAKAFEEAVNGAREI